MGRGRGSERLAGHTQQKLTQVLPWDLTIITLAQKIAHEAEGLVKSKDH